MVQKRVQEAIEEIKKGNMVIMLDDEDRENEGDLVYASTFSTPQKVNFMATHAKGLICVSISEKIAQRLNLAPMTQKNDSSHETAFTVSVDAKNCTTGISAFERDETIKILADYSSKPSELVRPGHIFPLIAKDGGTLVRTGHTEGSVDLCRFAGVVESAVICEIMNEDGTMARRDDLEIFAKKHNLKTIYISDIVEYRMRHESLVRIIAQGKEEFFDFNTSKIDFIDHKSLHHIAFIFGAPQNTTNVKFHHINDDIKLLSSSQKYKSFLSSVKYLKNNGGILIFLNKEYEGVDYAKEFGIGAQILNKLGIQNINLLTSKKGNDFVALSGFGLNVIDEIIV